MLFPISNGIKNINMKKKILLGLGALALAVVTVPMFAAFEAHVINVTATIENALSVTTQAIDFGTVFPQEHLDKPLQIALSGSFLTATGTDYVSYIIRQKPKCGLTSLDGQTLIGPTATGHVNPDGNGGYAINCGKEPVGYVQGQNNWGVLPSLCEYISKKSGSDELTGENDGITYSFHKPFTTPTSTVNWNDTAGLLLKAGNQIDNWTIDLSVPCFGGYCAQDWADFVDANDGENNAIPDDYVQLIGNEHKVFGCDLWIEVTGVSRVQ